MTKRDEIRSAIAALYDSGSKLWKTFQKKEKSNFPFEYQSWYTKALKVVALLAPDRIAEFRGYYEADPKRKQLNYGTYTIQDYCKNIVPAIAPDFDSEGRALLCFFNQLTIFKAIIDRVDSILGDIESALYSDLQDSELDVATRLMKVNLRAAGVLVGVVIEGHLQKVAASHSVPLAKKHPTIADLNDPLKNASVIDLPTWRKISYFADIRNLCAHKKDREPTESEVEELIQGAVWVSKNIA